jgi:hypothetical protein
MPPNVHVWYQYHGEFVKITMGHHDFAKSQWFQQTYHDTKHTLYKSARVSIFTILSILNLLKVNIFKPKINSSTNKLQDFDSKS